MLLSLNHFTDSFMLFISFKPLLGEFEIFKRNILKLKVLLLIILKYYVSSEWLPQVCSYVYVNSTKNQVHTNAVFGTRVFICSTHFVLDTLIGLVGNRR